MVKIQKDWVVRLFYCSFKTKKQGMVSFIHKKLNFELLKQCKNEGGRFICMEAVVNRMKLNLCKIYAPNTEDADFFMK